MSGKRKKGERSGGVGSWGHGNEAGNWKKKKEWIIGPFSQCERTQLIRNGQFPAAAREEGRYKVYVKSRSKGPKNAAVIKDTSFNLPKTDRADGVREGGWLGIQRIWWLVIRLAYL